MWIKGDLHVHSNCCHDGTLPVAEIVERAREYCDFTAISGHCRKVEFPRIKQQYAEVLKALQKFDIPMFARHWNGRIQAFVRTDALFFCQL